MLKLGNECALQLADERGIPIMYESRTVMNHVLNGRPHAVWTNNIYYDLLIVSYSFYNYHVELDVVIVELVIVNVTVISLIIIIII